MAGANVRRWGPVSPEPRPTREGQVSTLGCSPEYVANKTASCVIPAIQSSELCHPDGGLSGTFKHAYATP